MMIRDAGDVGVIPPPEQCAVFIDFDGTLTTQDVLDVLIRKYAPEDCWVEAERLWAEGKIGSYECLSRELSAIRIAPVEFSEFIHHVAVDPDMSGFFRFLQHHRVPVTILSDGIESIIHHVLQNHGIQNVAVRANRARDFGRRLCMQYPWRSTCCSSGSAHCKCASMMQLKQGFTTIYIGDGRSDLCVAQKADVCFAKATLAQLLREKEKPCLPFAQLGEVQRCLSQMWSSSTMVLQ